MDKLELEAKLAALAAMNKEPSPEEMEAYERSHFEAAKQNPNMFSNWFPKIKDCGLAVPESIVIPLTLDQFRWLISDSYSDEAIRSFSDSVASYLNDHAFRVDRTLFLKTGLFSGKFNFVNCKLTDIRNIGQQFLNIFYDEMCVGCDDASELVVREFIDAPKALPTIYNGMPLNTEFRSFFDFDRRKILGVFNYWDTKTMLAHLHGRDLADFAAYSRTLEKNFEQSKDVVAERVAKAMRSVDMAGKWSVDTMLVGDKLYLTDMGRAEESYYFNRLENE